MNSMFRQYKLSSGEEIICEVHRVSNNEIEVSDVVAIKADREREVVIMEPWIYNQMDMTRRSFLNMNHVVASYEPEEDFVMNYLQVINTLDINASNDINIH